MVVVARATVGAGARASPAARERRRRDDRAVGAEHGHRGPRRACDQRPGQSARHAGDEGRGDEVPGRGHGSVLAHDHGLVEAVAVVLPPQALDGAAAVVRRADRRVHPDPAPGPGEAQVELVVLVAHQLLVEDPDAVEHLPPVGAEGQGVDEGGLGRGAEGHAAHPDAGALRGGDGPGGRRLPDGLHGPAHALHARGRQRVEAAAEVVGGDDAVAVHPHDDVGGRRGEGQVHRHRDDAPGVVEDRDLGAVGGRDLAHAVGGAVVGVPVDDDHLRRGDVVLGEHRTQALVDEGALVADRHDDRDAWGRWAGGRGRGPGSRGDAARTGRATAGRAPHASAS